MLQQIQASLKRWLWPSRNPENWIRGGAEQQMVHIFSSVVYWLFRNVMQICTQKLGALNIVSLVQLFVDGVGSICRAAHWQQQYVLSSRLFKGQCDGNTSTFPCHIRSHSKYAFHSFSGCHKIPVLWACDPPFSVMLKRHMDRIFAA